MRLFLMINSLALLLLVTSVSRAGDGHDQQKSQQTSIQFGKSVNGMRFGLTTDSFEVPMGAALNLGLALRFNTMTADKKTRLLNCGDAARSVRFIFKHVETGKSYERRPLDVGLPPALGPADIVNLDKEPVPAKKVLVPLLRRDGQQIPPGRYEVSAIYVNNANPRVEIVVTPNGSIRHEPHQGPLEFWTGKLVSAPIKLTVLPAKTKLIDIKTNSHLVVRNTAEGIGWKWGRQMPIRLRVRQRPGYIVGARYDLHVFLDGKEVEFGGGGLGGLWHNGDGESFLPPRIGRSVAKGAKLTLRADVTIFETSVPVQHLWHPEDGDFKVLRKESVEGTLTK